MTDCRRLSEIASVFNGKTPAKAEQRESGHPVLKIRDVSEHNTFHGHFESYVEPQLAAKHRDRWVLEGDSLILNAAHNAEYVASKMFFAGHEVEGALPTGEWTVVRANTGLVEAGFINYWLRSQVTRKSIKSLVKGIHLYPKDVGTLSVPVPPLPEQRRLVDILSRAEGIVRLHREALAKTRELIPALFLDLFGDPATNPKGWPVKTLGELISDGPQNGLYKHASAYGEGVPIVRIDAFYDGRLSGLTTLRRLRLTGEEITRYGLREGDILINRVNSPEYLGKSAVVPALSEPVVFESNMMRLAVDGALIRPGYLIQHLQTGHIKTLILSKAKHAINQSSINQQDVKSFPVPIPPLHLQNAFFARVAEIESIQSQTTTALVAAEATFQSLLHRAFQTTPDANGRPAAVLTVNT